VLGQAGRGVPPNGRIDSWSSRVGRAAETIALDASQRYTAYMTHLSRLQRDQLYTPEFRELVGESIVPDVIGGPWDESSARHPLDRMLDVDVRTYLADDLLAKMDVATMAHSLEARSPLLDRELMEFAAALPPRMKLRGRQKKFALRAALRGWVPDQILDSPKQGFNIPLDEWFRNDLGQFANEVLLDPTTVARNRFHEGQVRHILEDHRAARQDHSQAIWTLLMLELWEREFIDVIPGSGAGAPVPATASPAHMGDPGSEYEH
jgi:asparagine synthase (glutamine-hydrolysing)